MFTSPRESVIMQSGQTEAEIVESLKRRARELWGVERAEAIQDIIEQTAEHVHRVFEDLPTKDEEPGFYF